MQFKYFKVTKEYSSEFESDNDGYEFTYEPDYSEVLKAIAYFIMEDYLENNTDMTATHRKLIEKMLVKMLVDFDTEQFEEAYYERLKDWFYDDAMESER